MSTCRWPSTPANDRMTFTPIGSALVNLRNAAGTIAVIARTDGSAQAEFAGVTDSAVNAWYHGLRANSTDSKLSDDDGVVGATAATLTAPANLTPDAGKFYICGVDWPNPNSGAATERFHISSTFDSAESWSHENSTGNNGATPAANASGTSGKLCIGDFADGIVMRGDLALIGIWQGTRFTDTDWTNLWVNKKTSDWWNHPAGNPSTLIEMTSLTPTDVGSSASTFSAATAGVTLTGLDPTGWTFDGRSTVQTLLPDADNATGGWATAPLFSKINDSSDATVISATAA